MARTTQQERFADAFLLATAAAAGCSVAKPDVDDDSIDWTLSCRLLPRRPKLDVQMKSTIKAARSGPIIRYPLRRKNYDDLIMTELLAPRILILVMVPVELQEWIDMSAQRMVLRHCAYWLSLAGEPISGNDFSINVSVPRANIFTVDALRGMMRSINEGGAP